MSDEPLQWCLIDETIADGLAPLVRREQAAVRRWRWLAGTALFCAGLLLTGATWQALQSLWIRDALEEAGRESSSAAAVIKSAVPEVEKLRDAQKRDVQAREAIRQELREELTDEAVRRRRAERQRQIEAALAGERKAALMKPQLPAGPKGWRDYEHAGRPKACPYMGGNRPVRTVIEEDDEMPDGLGPPLSPP